MTGFIAHQCAKPLHMADQLLATINTNIHGHSRNLWIFSLLKIKAKYPKHFSSPFTFEFWLARSNSKAHHNHWLLYCNPLKSPKKRDIASPISCFTASLYETLRFNFGSSWNRHETFFHGWNVSYYANLNWVVTLKFIELNEDSMKYLKVHNKLQ